MFYFNRQNPDVLFGDKRRESHILCDGRKLEINPDQMLDFTRLPFQDGRFKLVVFDPPHLKSAGPKSWLKAKYGKLPPDWKEYLSAGFRECFRVLDPNGVLIFKWNEAQIKVREVLKCSPFPPLFGHVTGLNGRTHWCAFMRPEDKNIGDDE